MLKFSFRSALAVAVFCLASSTSDAGGHCKGNRPVRDFFSKVAERWHSRGERIGRFACQVAERVQPSVTLTFADGKPEIGFSYRFVAEDACSAGRCTQDK